LLYLVFNDVLWFSMIYFGFQWLTLVFNNVLWFSMIYFGFQWLTLVSNDLHVFPLIYIGLSFGPGCNLQPTFLCLPYPMKYNLLCHNRKLIFSTIWCPY
jgi:hypothetical protein